MKINATFIFITMAVVFFAMSSAQPIDGSEMDEDYSDNVCDNNSDCHDTEQCVNNQCIGSCDRPYPCGAYTTCTPRNHQAVCKCSVAYGGDPFTGCTRLSSEEAEEQIRHEYGEKALEEYKNYYISLSQ